ncbi:MAG: glutamyl-tRNA reductase [Lachnospiraceae bacterium]
MSISMIGIDHSHAGVDVRSIFSFTQKHTAQAVEAIAAREGILGCIMISTCNRIELWVSTATSWKGSLYDLICAIKGVSDPSYEVYFSKRSGREAVEHLFRLAAGLKSQIIGEDQIITQVKSALSLAREHFATDNILEVLFRKAITAGKRIKTEIVFPKENMSATHKALELVQKQGVRLDQAVCMVIGNGEMGKLTAQALQEAGADVTVTIRQYRSGIVDIPLGCKRINYGERMQLLPSCDLVVSATVSPNYTLREEQFETVQLTKPLTLIDLAVPRDIEVGLAAHEQITLYDTDSLKTDTMTESLSESMQQASLIVEKYMAEFYEWYECRDLFPRICEIREEAVNDLNLRIMKNLQKSGLSQEARTQLLEAIDTAAGKVVGKMIFGLQDRLDQESFLQCVSGLEKIYEH